MGTNFYFHESGKEPLHIGKSSAGWVFALHVYPDDGINDLPDWFRYWDSQEGEIRDEYERIVPVLEMLDRITKRSWENSKLPPGYASWEQFHAMNHTEPGPNGLLRTKIGCGRPCAGAADHEPQSFTSGCVKHGEGTWDCIVGEFS